MYIGREQRPSVLNTTTCVAALLVHGTLFLILWGLGQLKFTEKLEVIPIDLTVVVQENLNGVEDEPPPEKPPEPKPPEPKPEPPKPPEPKPEPESPKPKLEDIVVPEPVKTNVVKQVEKPKEPEKPKLTREERIQQMLASATDVKTPPTPKPKPVTNGRTGPKTLSDAEIAKLMAQGYRPGRVESLATDDNQRCFSLIKMAFYDKWTDRPPWKSTLRDVVLAVSFAGDGRVTGYRIVESSGDSRTDNSVLHAAAGVTRVPGLTHDFLRANPRVDVQFHVTPSL